MPLYEPTSGVGVGNLGQTAFTSTAVDVSTASTTFVDLLTLTITTTYGNLLCWANASSSNANANAGNYFRITVDGTSIGATAQRYTNVPAITGAVIARASGLTPGSHTVKLQWRCDGGTARVRPVTSPDIEFASLLIEEVSS